MRCVVVRDTTHASPRSPHLLVGKRTFPSICALTRHHRLLSFLLPPLQSNLPGFQSRAFQIRRKYSDFLWIHEYLMVWRRKHLLPAGSYELLDGRTCAPYLVCVDAVLCPGASLNCFAAVRKVVVKRSSLFRCALPLHSGTCLTSLCPPSPPRTAPSR